MGWGGGGGRQPDKPWTSCSKASWGQRTILTWSINRNIISEAEKIWNTPVIIVKGIIIKWIFKVVYSNRQNMFAAKSVGKSSKLQKLTSGNVEN